MDVGPILQYLALHKNEQYKEDNLEGVVKNVRNVHELVQFGIVNLRISDGELWT